MDNQIEITQIQIFFHTRKVEHYTANIYIVNINDHDHLITWHNSEVKSIKSVHYSDYVIRNNL